MFIMPDVHLRKTDSQEGNLTSPIMTLLFACKKEKEKQRERGKGKRRTKKREKEKK